MADLENRTFVFDACALIAYLKKETGGDVVADLLSDPENHCKAHAINACEVFYNVLKAADKEKAQDAIGRLRQDGLMIVTDTDDNLWQQAGLYKVTLPVMPSIADCFCLALAVREDAQLITGDHPDFDPIEQLRLVKVRFIR
ncbi:MAG: PIN domain-containing protein [Armatimonadetes bacterium]|nr:PIN domain-containing protein [Armatimonadota bacterium]